MAGSWSPREVGKLIAITTGCLCLLVVVVSTMLGISRGLINPDHLGTATGVGVGGGVVGLSAVLYLVIKAGLVGSKIHDEP